MDDYGRGGDGGRGVRVKLFVKEEREPPKACDLEVPAGCDFQPLHDLVCDAVLGSASDRWTLVSEQKVPHLGPDGGGHIDIQQEWQSKEVSLFTHPADDCCPTAVGPEDLHGGADVYSLMLGNIAKRPIASSQSLDSWWHSHPAPGPPLLPMACGRLLAKLRAMPSPAAPAAAVARLVGEGLAGLRELASDRWYGNRLPTDLLEQGLLAALRWERHAPPGRPELLAEVLEAASAAAWALATYGGPRSAMVSAGAVAELAQALKRAAEWRALALERGEATSVRAAESQREATEAAVAALTEAAEKAAKTEAEEAEKSAGSPELEAAILAADAAAEEAARAPLPDGTPYNLADCYLPPDGQVSLATANRISYNCLGALAVLAVDSKARAACLAVSPKLDFFLTAATADFPTVAEGQHALDVEAWRRRQDRRTAADAATAERVQRRREEKEARKARAEQEARERAEREAAEAAEAARLEEELAAEAERMAAEDPELAALMKARKPPSKPATPTPPAEASQAEGGVADGGEGGEADAEDDGPAAPTDPYPLPPVVAAEDLAIVHQVMAAEALYAMLGRERGVRRAFAAAGGVAALGALLRCPNQGVMCAAMSCLAAYGRDVGHDHTSGLDMLATAASPPPPPAPPPAPSPGGGGGKRSILPPAAAPTPPQPKKDPAIENAGKVVSELIEIVPPVLEDLIGMYGDGDRHVGGVDAMEEAAAAAAASEAAAAADAAAGGASVGGDAASGAYGHSEAGGSVRVPSPDPNQRAFRSSFSRTSAVSRATTTAGPGAGAGISFSARTGPVAGGAGGADAPLPRGLSVLRRVTLNTVPSGMRGPQTSLSEPTPRTAGGLRGCFLPHSLSDVIEISATALWALVAAEHRSAEIRAAAEIAAEAEAVAAAAAAVAAAAAAAAAKATARTSFGGNSLDGADSSTLLGGGGGSSSGNVAAAPQPPAPPPPPAVPLRPVKQADVDAIKSGLSTERLKQIASLAVAAGKLVPTELDELLHPDADPDDAGGHYAAAASVTAYDSEYMAGGDMDDEEDDDAGGGGGGARSVAGKSVTGRSVAARSVAGRSVAAKSVAARSVRAPSHTAARSTAGTSYGAGGADGDGYGNGGNSGGGGGAPVAPHSHMLGALHALLGSLVVAYGSNRLVRTEFASLLTGHATLRRLHVQKELYQEELQVLVNELEAARRQPGRFFFEEEEEAKREEVQKKIRDAERGMRRQLRALAAAEDGLQAAAEAAVRAVATALALLPYAPAASAQAAAGVVLRVPDPLPYTLDFQLGHCHVLSAGVVQALAATLQPGAVDAAAAAAAQVQRNWEAETSVSAAADATAAAEAADASGASPEALAAATAAAALYQGPFRDLILGSGVMEVMLAATAARYGTASTAAAVAAAAGGTTGGGGGTGTGSGGAPRSGAAGSFSAGPNAAGIGGLLSRASRATSVSSGSQREAGGGGGSFTGNADRGEGGRAGSPPRDVRHSGDALDVATHVLMQVTSAALMYLASTESPLKSQQLVSVMSYMRTACHHAASGPFLSAAVYSLSRHVDNRRGMVEGVVPPPPRKQHIFEEGAAGATLSAGLLWAKSTANAPKLNANGDPPPAAKVSFTPGAAAAAAAAPPPTLGTEVWVEVLEALMKPVLARLRRPTPSQQRVSIADSVASTMGGFGPGLGNGSLGVGAGIGPGGGGPVGAALAMGLGGTGGGGGGMTTPLRSGRFLSMAAWLLLRQWLVDKVNPVNMISSAEGLFAPGGCSFWSVLFDVDTPLELSPEVLDALALLVEAAHACAAASASAAAAAAAAAHLAAAAVDPFHHTHHISFAPEHGTTGGGGGFGGTGPYADGGGGRPAAPAVVAASGIAALRRLAVRCVWSLSSAHPAVAAALAERGSGVLALAAMRDTTAAADSELQALCSGYLLQLASRCAPLLPPLGGLDALAVALVSLVERALAAGGSWPSAPTANADPSGAGSSGSAAFGGAADGRGVDVALLEAAVRGLAWIAGSGDEGRAAVVAARGVRRLVAVVRADNAALAAVRERRAAEGTPAWVRVEELICPLRAINDLPITVPAAQAASQAALQPSQPPSRPASAAATATPVAGTPPPPSGHALSRNASRIPASAVAAAKAATPPPRPGTAVGGGARASPAGGRPASASPAASRRSPSPGLSGSAAAESPRPGGGGGHGEVDEDLLIQSRQSGDADVGLTALWGLLNLSGYAPAQTRICRHGLYTLMACVHGSADPARSAAARATLSNIHYHPGNATVLYKAELKLKYAALARLLEQEEAAKAAQEASLKRAAAVVMEDIRAKANGGARPGSAAPGGAGGGGGGNSMRPSSAAANRPHSARPGSAHPRGAAAARRPGGVAAELARQQLGVLAAAARAAASGGESGAPSPTGFGAPSPMPLAPPSPAANAAPLAAGTRPGATDALMASLSAALAQTASGGVPSDRELPPGRSLLNVTRPGALMMPGGADGGSDSDGGGGGALDADVIAARLRFLTWMADPTAKAGIDAAVPMPPTPGAGGGEGGWMGGGGDDTAAAVAAAAAAGEDPNLLATLTSDPEERRWLDMVARMQREEAREEAKAAAGNFMRGVLSRSLAAGAHSLWKEQDDGSSGGGGGGSTARGGGSGGANSRRQGSARRPSTGGAPGANAGGGGANRPRSASVGRGASPLAAAGGGGGGPRRPGSALRGSAPSPTLAWPPAARAAAASTAVPSPPPASRAAASNAASSRFANLYGIHPGVPITPRGGRHPLKPVAARLPPSVSGGGGGGGSSAGGGGGPAATHSRRKGSAFSLTSNPWAPHILRYVSDPPSTGGPPARGELATRMLTAAAPEYVTEELAGLTERLMTMTTDRRRQEEADRAAAEAAAAAAVEEEQAEEARRRLGVSKSGRLLAVLPIAKEASQLSHDGFGFDFGAGGGGGGFSAGEALTKDGVGLLAEGSAGGGGNDGPGSMRSGLGSKLMGFGSASMSGKTGFFAALDNALGRPSPREGSREPGSGGASVRPEGSLAGGVSAVGSVAGGGGGGGGSVRGERSGASAAAAAVVEEPLDPEDEPVEPRSIQLLVSLLPPVLLGPAGAGAGPAYDAEDADTASDGGGGAPSVIPAPASVIAGGGALTAVPSTYLPGAANGAAAAASLLSASQAPSGLPHDSAASLVSTTSYDTISAVDPSLAAALQNPAEAYRKPRLGLAAPPGTLVSRLRSAKPDSSVLAVAAANAASVAAANAAAAAVMSSGRGAASAGSVAAAAAAPSSGGKAGKVPGGSNKGAALSALAASGKTTTFVDDALAKGEPLMPISDSVPRPVTVLAGSVADLLAAKQAREADAANRLLRATTTTVGDDSEAGPASPSALASARTARAGRSFSGTGAPPLRSSLSMVGPGGAKLAAAVGGGGGGGSPGDRGGGGAAADEEDPATEMLKPQPLSVLVATGDGGTDRLYRFPRLLLPGAQHMCLFEHVDGCRFCEALYGHYLLPNGTLAHFYLGDTVVKGHRVDLSPAPAIPFAPADWVSDGLPACGALADWGAATPGRLSHYHAAHTHHPPSAAPHAVGGGGEDGAGRGERGVLLAALWCPVPLTAAPVPPERRSALEWGVGEAGEPRLEMRSLALEVRLTAVRRTDVRQEIVVPPPAPTTKGRKKKAGGKPGAAAGKSPGRR